MRREHRAHAAYERERSDRHSSVRNYLILAVGFIVALVVLAVWLTAETHAQTTGVATLSDPIILTQAPPTGLNAFGNFGMQMLGYVLSVGVTIITGFASKWLHGATVFKANQDESLSADRLNNVILRGIDFATTASKNQVAKKGSGQTEFKYDDLFLALASGFIKGGAPDLLETFRLTSDQPRLNNMIMARLPISGEVPAISGAISTSSAMNVARAEGHSDHFSLASDAPLPSYASA